MPDMASERAAAVRCACAWLRTPYHHRGRIKGAGVDCAMLLAEVYAEAGLVPALAIPHYPTDWHLHRDAERYLGVLLDHAVEYIPVIATASAAWREAIQAGSLRRPYPEPRTSPSRRFAPQDEVRRAKDAPQDEVREAKDAPRDDGKGVTLYRPILPGDIALWRFGRCFSHGAIVVDWPIVIHAYLGRGCVLEDAARAEWLSRIGEGRDAQAKPRPVRFFTLKRWVYLSLRDPAGSEAIQNAGSLPASPSARGRDDVELH